MERRACGPSINHRFQHFQLTPIGIEPGAGSEGDCELSRNMAVLEPIDRRRLHPVQHLHDNLFQGKVRIFGISRCAPGEAAEQQSGNLRQHAGIAQLSEHPVQPVEMLAHVFQNEQRAAIVRAEWGAQV